MATAGQIAKYVADGATGEMKLQGADLATVATSGSYSDLTGTPVGLTTSDILIGTDTTNKLASAQTMNAAIGGYATTAGTGSAYTATLPSGFVLENGARVMLKVHVANAENATLNINGTGAKIIRRNSSYGVAGGQMYNNSVVVLIYNSSDDSYYLINASGKGTVSELLDGSGVVSSTWSPSAIKLGILTYGGAIVTTAGTSSAYTISDTTNYTSTLANLNAGTKVVVKMHLANAAGATLNLNGIGAKAIYFNDAPITEGLLQGDGTYTLVYDDTNWNVVMTPNAGTIPLPTAECLDSDKSCVLRFGTFTPLLQLLPAGYTALEYIQSSGTQYIDTGHIVTENDVIEADLQHIGTSDTGDKMFFGTYHQNTSLGGLWVEQYGTANTWYVRFGSPYSSSAASTNDERNNKIHISVSKQNFSVDGVQRLTPVWSGSFQTTTLTIFGRRNAPTGISMTSKLNLWSFMVTRSGVLKLNLVPAKRNSDNVIGMYDTVSGQFLTNAGTGTFTAGPELPGQSGDTTIGHYWEVVER